MRRDPSSLVPHPDPRTRELGFAALAFVLTTVSVFLVNLPRWSDESWWSLTSMRGSVVFTTVLMFILAAHEAGHWMVARWHRFRLGPPWFLPFPWFIGTMGAVIVPREAPRDRDALAEMGAAGPLAGGVVIVGVLFVQAAVSVPLPPIEGDLALAAPPIWTLLGLWSGNEAAPSVRDPVAFACWVGCLITAMNLLPFGQLDGGHIVSALCPRVASGATWGVTAVLLLLGVVWQGWLVWVVLLHVVGSRRSLDPRTHIPSPGRRAHVLAGLAVVLFVLFALPVPFPG